MQTELHDCLAKVRSHSCAQRFESAIQCLALAANHSHASGARKLLQEALLHLRALPTSMRRLAWLQTYGLPAARRTRASELQRGLWRRGINRSALGPAPICGMTRLAAAWRDARDGADAMLLQDIASTGAFEVLIGSASDDDLTWEAIALHDAVDGAGNSNIKMLATKANLDELEKASALAAWLRGLSDDAPDHPHPPSSRLTAIALAMPELRGLRRRGARQHGSRIGRSVAEATADLSRGSKRVLEVDLPPCLVADDPLRPLVAPLVQDLLSCAAAACSARPDLEFKIRNMAECCPRLLDSAMTTHDFEGSPARPGGMDRLYWLQSLLGLVTLERAQAIDEDAQRRSLDDRLETLT